MNEIKPKNKQKKVSDLTVEQNLRVDAVLAIVQISFDSTRPFFGNPFARKAAHERITKTGYEETVKVLETFNKGIAKKADFRPSFSSPTVMLTSGWMKVTAFVDRESPKKSGLKIVDEIIKGKIVEGLESGGFQKDYKK